MGSGDIDQHGRQISRLSIARRGIIKKLGDRMRRKIGKLLHAAVSGQTGGVANQSSEFGMIRMLVLDEARRKNDSRPRSADNAGELDRVRDADFEMGIAIKLR